MNNLATRIQANDPELESIFEKINRSKTLQILKNS
jgi:hypothetical protein